MMQEESWKCRLWYSVTCRTTQNAKNNGRDEWIWSNSQGKVPANLQADRQRRATGIKNDSRGPGLAGGKRPGLHNWTTKSDLLYHGWKSVAGCRMPGANRRHAGAGATRVTGETNTESGSRCWNNDTQTIRWCFNLWKYKYRSQQRQTARNKISAAGSRWQTTTRKRSRASGWVKYDIFYRVKLPGKGKFWEDRRPKIKARSGKHEVWGNA